MSVFFECRTLADAVDRRGYGGANLLTTRQAHLLLVPTKNAPNRDTPDNVTMILCDLKGIKELANDKKVRAVLPLSVFGSLTPLRYRSPSTTDTTTLTTTRATLAKSSNTPTRREASQLPSAAPTRSRKASSGTGDSCTSFEPSSCAIRRS